VEAVTGRARIDELERPSASPAGRFAPAASFITGQLIAVNGGADFN
jgi:hypothetical protein